MQSLSLIIFGVFITIYVQAEGTPLDRVMHRLSGAMECLQGTLPAFLCNGGDEEQIKELREGLKGASDLIKSIPHLDSEQQISAQTIFTQMNQALDQLNAAVLAKDAVARTKAIESIVSLRDQGHAAFMRRPSQSPSAFKSPPGTCPEAFEGP